MEAFVRKKNAQIKHLIEQDNLLVHCIYIELSVYVSCIHGKLTTDPN